MEIHFHTPGQHLRLKDYHAWLAAPRFVYFRMARLDLIILIVFSSVTVLSFLGSYLCFRRALRVANEKDGDVKMFFWALGTLATLTLGGMSAAYFLLPFLLR